MSGLSVRDLMLTRRAVTALRDGGLIAYPTEAVFGLGCDPANRAALRRLLRLKRRPQRKGLILIGADFAQLRPWLQPLPAPLRARVCGDWPGPVTWVLPARAGTSRLLRGNHAGLAVRVTSHPQAALLCRLAGGAIVSTSANLSGRRPARSAGAVRGQFRGAVDAVLSGPTGGRARPSEVRTLSGRVLRGG